MTKAGWVGGAVSALLFLCALAVAPAAAGPIDECFDYADSAWSNKYMTCAGTGGGCSICVGSVIVYKEQDSGGPMPPLGTEFAAVLPGWSGMEGWLGRSESYPSVQPIGEFFRVERACSEDPGLFDALDPRHRPERVPGRRAAVRVLPPAPAP